MSHYDILSFNSAIIPRNSKKTVIFAAPIKYEKKIN
ncbi:hypothetical protein SAMN05444407_11169 [Chryseobacterium contaminans]|uniref:Uncharacterized protein n=1 Tax=Chryseobacterium contaminans TaxID=1423959 RepID=A0A1M7H4K0_9FLAO|nr:hypothetical protein SAMN05444407_11169 [Chryseobacterium contaminans]